MVQVQRLGTTINILPLVLGRLSVTYGLTTDILERRRQLNELLDRLILKGVTISEPYLIDLRRRLPLETPCQQLRQRRIDWQLDAQSTLLDLRSLVDQLPGQGHLSAVLPYLEGHLEQLASGLYLVLPYRFGIKAFALRIDPREPGRPCRATVFYVDIETPVEQLLEGATLPLYLLTAASSPR